MATGVGVSLEAVHAWSAPEAQPAGSGWLFELFTPPEIRNDGGVGLVARPASGRSGQAESADGLELVAVERAPYRVQLVGYAGSPRDYLVAFADPVTREGFSVREGTRIASKGVVLKRFEVRKVRMAGEGIGPVYDVVAVAELYDEELNEEVVVDNRSLKLTETPRALLRSSAGKVWPVREGESVTDGDATWRVERISFEPPGVEIVRSVAGTAASERRNLRPVGPSGALSAETSGVPAIALVREPGGSD